MSRFSSDSTREQDLDDEPEVISGVAAGELLVEREIARRHEASATVAAKRTANQRIIDAFRQELHAMSPGLLSICTSGDGQPVARPGRIRR